MIEPVRFLDAVAGLGTVVAEFLSLLVRIGEGERFSATALAFRILGAARFQRVFPVIEVSKWAVGFSADRFVLLLMSVNLSLERVYFNISQYFSKEGARTRKATEPWQLPWVFPRVEIR